MDGCSAKKMGEEMEDEEEMNKDYMTTVGLLLGVVGLVCTWCVYRPSYSYSSHYKGLLLHETAQASRAGMYIHFLYIHIHTQKKNHEKRYWVYRLITT
jgi:hypothetical protein